jgi:hypothetical protein
MTALGFTADAKMGVLQPAKRRFRDKPKLENLWMQQSAVYSETPWALGDNKQRRESKGNGGGA